MEFRTNVGNAVGTRFTGTIHREQELHSNRDFSKFIIINFICNFPFACVCVCAFVIYSLLFSVLFSIFTMQ